MKKQSGFTLIELVIVVVILGFLAVTAIPKFLDLTDQAKQANIEGMAGGFATAVSLARAQWEAEGRPKNAASQNLVDYDGTTVYLTKETFGSIRPGYITGLSDRGDTLGGFVVNDCVDIWNNILQQPPGITSSISTLNTDSTASYYAMKTGSNATSLCHYFLKESLEKNAGAYVAPSAPVTETGNSFSYEPSSSEVIVYINN